MGSPLRWRPTERVRSEAGKVAAFRLRCLVERVAHARIPQRLARVPLLLKHERVGLRTVRVRFRLVTLDQVADTQHALTPL